MAQKRKLFGILTCPECGHKQKMEIPQTLCRHAYRCDNCKKIIKGKKKCIFCEYADKRCPIGC